MDQHGIKIQSNIQSIGWVFITLSALLLIFSASQLAKGFFVMGSQILDEIESVDAGFYQNFTDIFRMAFIIHLGTSILSIAMIVIGRGLINFKNWAPPLFTLVNSLFVITILTWVVYLAVDNGSNMFSTESELIHGSPAHVTQKNKNFATISTGSIALIIAWAITRVNLLLLKKSYMAQFN